MGINNIYTPEERGLALERNKLKHLQKKALRNFWALAVKIQEVEALLDKKIKIRRGEL